ncbi:acetate--CoA ligase family protein [uncultured Castellaniella sp.]|uniref:acetate--CoA ligase family protein n=1 Tax=uncultured Castellaniella sp. TaxID=647907 RepID=UPI002626E1C3|nr:acetate--CoA ligase family protein [uncultured Castellaniella sp.]
MSSAVSAEVLSRLINPGSVAVIGASEDQTKFGGRLYRMLLKHGYGGRIYPVNPFRERLFDIPAFPSVDALPQAPDMVVMAVPQAKVKEQVAACAERGARCGIVITSKFSDDGPQGAALEREIVDIARSKGMRLIGPNCLGLVSPANRLVMCSSPAMDVDRLIESPIGFISQSGALMATLFDRMHAQGVGFSHCISVGNQADLELCDFVEMLIHDPRTRVICTYIEGIKSPDRFVDLARRAREAGKPWLAVKAGRTAAGGKATFSHTASMAGDYAALQAVCARDNIILMEDPAAMLLLAHAMESRPGRTVDRVAIVTPSGGGGALAADRLCESGIPLADFTPRTQAAFAEFYSAGQAQNPVDMGGRKYEAGENSVDVAERTVQVVLADEGVDAGLVALTTAPMLGSVTEALVKGAESSAKPLLFVVHPGRAAQPSREFLRSRRVPYTDALSEAVEALAAWRRWSAFQPGQAALRPGGCGPFESASGVRNEHESKRVLAEAGIPVNREVIAADEDEAVLRASEVGFPLAAKVISPMIVHKSDVGGVLLGVRDAAALGAGLRDMRERIARSMPQAEIQGFSLQSMETGELELILGARRDPQFGAQVLIGGGGVLVELLKDFAVLPAPVDPATVLRALRALKIAPLLEAYRGRAALDVDAVADAVVRLSWLAHDWRATDFEIEINPLKVRLAGQGCVAVDARARKS